VFQTGLRSPTLYSLWERGRRRSCLFRFFAQVFSKHSFQLKAIWTESRFCEETCQHRHLHNCNTSHMLHLCDVCDLFRCHCRFVLLFVRLHQCGDKDAGAVDSVGGGGRPENRYSRRSAQNAAGWTTLMEAFGASGAPTRKSLGNYPTESKPEQSSGGPEKKLTVA